MSGPSFFFLIDGVYRSAHTTQRIHSYINLEHRAHLIGGLAEQKEGADRIAFASKCDAFQSSVAPLRAAYVSSRSMDACSGRGDCIQTIFMALFTSEL